MNKITIRQICIWSHSEKKDRIILSCLAAESNLTLVRIFAGDSGRDHVAPWLRLVTRLIEIDWTVTPGTFTVQKTYILDVVQR